MSQRNFFAELKRRNVYKVAVAYAVVGWLVIQVCSTVLPTFHAPEWVVQTLVVLVALGFPVALVIAWAFELTPEGIKRTEEVAVAKRPKRYAWIYVVAAAAILSIGLFLLGRYTGRNNPSAARTEAAAGSSIPQKSIAVLPFENLSDDKGNAYFADGIQDQILTKLASVADLKVISRTSTAKYKSKPEDLKTVSRELGVAHVLEGTVQRAGEKVRVNVQLIDARVDSHLWAKSYDRDLKDVFAIQSEVAQEIADALRAKLSPSEARALAVAPTSNPAAYDLFLRGEAEMNEGVRSFTVPAFERAATYYREALSRDPNFALAAARLARCRLTRHWYASPLTPGELEEVKSIIELAVRLAPELADAHVALGLFEYWGYRRYEVALEHFRRVLDLQPNSADGRQFCAAVYRRQGKWERALAAFDDAEKLSPRDAEIPANISVTRLNLRQWDIARSVARRALALHFLSITAFRALLLSHINGDGDIAAARRSLDALPERERVGTNVPGTVAQIIDERTYLHVIERNFEAALAVWQTEATEPIERARSLTARAAIHLLAGDSEKARREGEQACPLLEARIRDFPEDTAAMSQLSWAYLASGRSSDAVRLARQAVATVPVEKDAHAGPSMVTGLAEIQARVGEAPAAITALRQQLALPTGLSVSINRLKLDPVWDPIRNDPEFQQLLAGKEQIGPVK